MATIIFTPTEACNASCSYCNVVNKESRITKTMPLETLELLFVRINEFLLDRPKDFMGLIWHGGEPLILGPEYFEAAIDFQKKHCAKTSSRIRHAIQSNLTLLTADLVNLLKKLGITTVGSSCDPFSNLRGLGKTADASEYNRRYMDGLALLKKEGVECGIIYVVTKLSLEKPLDIFDYFTNLGVNGPIDFNPVLIYNDTLNHLKITAEEFTDFLGAIFPVWWRNRSCYPDIGPFTPLVRNLLDGDRRLACRDSGRCAYEYINIEPDGRLSHCNHSYDWHFLDYGTIYDKTFLQALADPKRKILLDRNRILFEGECKGCRFWNICHGGCPIDAWHRTGSFLHKSFFCGTKKDFIEKYVEPIIYGQSNGKSGRLPEKPLNESESGFAISATNLAPEKTANAVRPGKSRKSS